MKKRRKSRKSVKPPITIRDVAQLAKVSTATVSRVFSGAAEVRKELSERVRRAAQALSYRPNPMARSLRTRTTRVIGVVVPDIENPFFTSVTGGLEEVLRGAGYSLLLANSGEDPERERRNVEALRGEAIAGLIFTPSGGDLSPYQAFAAAGVPLVAVSRAAPGLDADTVTVTNREGARQAVEHLLSLGHRRIGMIGGPLSISTAAERLRGYEQALARHGGVSPELVEYAGFRQAGGYAAMKKLLALPKPPTAVFTASNLMTLGALQAIHEAGLKIPAGIAVVGFDDMPWAVSLQPPLTVVAQPAFEVGVTAGRLLIERLKEPGLAARHVELPARLIVRASSGAAGKSRARPPRRTQAEAVPCR